MDLVEAMSASTAKIKLNRGKRLKGWASNFEYFKTISMASDPSCDNIQSGATSEENQSNHAEIERNNPFDTGLLERLHRAAFTPSVFARVVSPSNSTDSPVSRPSTSRRNVRRRRFRWSIDHIAALNPAQIDESEVALQESHEFDEETEARLQRAIDDFFSQPIIAPSPWKSADTATTSSLRDIAASPVKPDVGESPLKACSDILTPENHHEGLRSPEDYGDDINSSVYLLSSSPESTDGSPFHLLTNCCRTSIGNKQFSSPDVSPIKLCNTSS